MIRLAGGDTEPATAAPRQQADAMSAPLRLLLSDIYPGNLAPEHLADLRKSGLTPDTIRSHHFRSVPPGMIPQLVGFNLPALRSAMLIPYPDPAGGFMAHIRVKVFPPLTDRQGHTVKYLQPRGSGARLFFPLQTLAVALAGDAALWLCEGEKKALAVAQLGLPGVGFAGIEGWHRAGSRDLLPDFAAIRLRERPLELVPDGDWRVNPAVERGAVRLAEALERCGACVRLVVLPAGVTR